MSFDLAPSYCTFPPESFPCYVYTNNKTVGGANNRVEKKTVQQYNGIKGLVAS